MAVAEQEHKLYQSIKITIKYETHSFILLCNGLQGAVAPYAANQTRTTSIYDECTVFLLCTSHMGPTALRPTRGTQQ